MALQHGDVAQRRKVSEEDRSLYIPIREVQFYYTVMFVLNFLACAHFYQRR